MLLVTTSLLLVTTIYYSGGRRTRGPAAAPATEEAGRNNMLNKSIKQRLKNEKGTKENSPIIRIKQILVTKENITKKTEKNKEIQKKT